MNRIAALLAACLTLAAHALPPAPPPIAARAYILVDTLSGQTLAGASEDEPFEPASLTKLMTAWLVFDALRSGALDPAKPVTVPEDAARAGGSRMFLTAGQSVAVNDLLQGMVVQSANDAAITLAQAVAGSNAAFVARMNAQAAKLGLAHTHFENPTGLPAPGHQSSARDLAALAQALIRDFPERFALYAQKEFSYNNINQANRNRLLWTDPTVDGMKTGFTESAGYCLVATARRGDRRLVSVVLGTQSDTLRTTESQKLLNFGFQAFDTRRLYKRGDSVGAPVIYKGTRGTVRLGFARDVWLTLPRDHFTGINAVLETRQPFVAPLAAGEKAGIMKLMRDNVPLAEVAVVALDDVPLAGFLSRGWDSFRLHFLSTP